MDFRFYFLKEGTRVYEQTDLITLLLSNPNITKSEDPKDANSKVYIYHHQVLNFDAKFVMADKAVIPHIEKLPPKYYDVNFYIQFDVLLSDYACEMILDIIEEITRKFKFYVYNQSLDNVSQFKRPLLLKIFQSWKKAFADRFPENVSKFNKLDPLAFTQVYSYLQKRKRLELTMSDEKVVVSNYVFFHTEKSRSAYVGVKWDGVHSFILPPAVDILLLDDGKTVRYVPMTSVMDVAEKMFKQIDAYGDLKQVEIKNCKKLHKLLVKTKFPPLSVKLEPLSLEKILDI